MDEVVGLLPSWRMRRKNSSKRNPYKEIETRGFVGRKGFRKPKPKVQRLGRARSWRLRMPKIRIRIVSPLKLLARLRDAYVNMMMSFAGKMGTINSLPTNHPGRRPEAKMCIFNDAELRYIEYLKRDPAFMRSIMRN